MKRKRFQSSFVEWALKQDILQGQKIFLLDVGASGGIDSFWKQFEPNFRAVGFDPLVLEVERLNRERLNEEIVYEAAWVGSDKATNFPTGTLYPFPFSTASAAAEITKQNYLQVNFNSGQEIIYSERRISLDKLLNIYNIFEIDALKIDTDGFDYFVLDGSENLLKNGQVLLVECECQMHEIAPGWPGFAEIDQLMRSAGYRLVDIDPWHYTRVALPGRFMYDIHAQTEDGQALFVDALYMLDPSIDASARDRLTENPIKLVKHALLLYAFGYSDLAADTLLLIKNLEYNGNFVIQDALDRMVPENPYEIHSYSKYTALFNRDPDCFLSSRWKSAQEKAGRSKNSKRQRGLIEFLQAIVKRQK